MASHTIDAKSEPVYHDNKIEDVAEKTSNSSAELEAQHVELDESESARVLRKVDMRLVPMLALLYLVAFIDRSNSKPTIPARNLVEMLTLLSRKCENRWNDERFEHVRTAIQHCSDDFLRSLHASRSAQQHHPQEDEAFVLDGHSHVLLGHGHDTNGCRE
jgi:hypothetical protein